MSNAESTLPDHWKQSLDTLAQLPADVVHELDSAWQSLEDYQAELNQWYEQLCREYDQLISSPPAATRCAAPPPPPVSPEAPPANDRPISSAARQFAALRRQCTGIRGGS